MENQYDQGNHRYFDGHGVYIMVMDFPIKNIRRFCDDLIRLFLSLLKGFNWLKVFKII